MRDVYMTSAGALQLRMRLSISALHTVSLTSRVVRDTHAERTSHECTTGGRPLCDINSVIKPAIALERHSCVIVCADINHRQRREKPTVAAVYPNVDWRDVTNIYQTADFRYLSSESERQQSRRVLVI